MNFRTARPCASIPSGSGAAPKPTRLSQKRARDREHLLLPAGKTSREQRAALAQDRKALVCRRDLGAVAAAESHEEVLFDRHSREDLAALGHLDDARAND